MSPSGQDRRRIVLLFLALVTATAFVSPALRDLFPGVESLYRRVVGEMSTGPSLLVPSLEGRPYSDKPPLHFWMVYALTLPLGLGSTWPFVIPSLLAFVGMQILIRRLSVEWFGGDGLLAVLVFSTFSLAWGLGQGARMDMSFTLLITAAIFALSRFRQQRRPLLLLPAGGLAGLAVLVKGPMAWLIVGSFFALEWRRALRPLPAVTSRLAVAAIALAFLVPAAWIVPAIRAGGHDYAYQLLVHQTVGRAFDAWANREPPWWYLQRFPATLFPWLALGLFALTALYRSRLSGRAGREADASCVHWLIAVLVPYTLISGKLDVYVLPALAPLALLCAHFVESGAPERWARSASVANVLAIAAVAVVAALVPFVSPLARDHLPALERLPEIRLAALSASTALVAIAALVALLVLARRDPTSQRRLLDTTLALGLVTFYPQAYYTFALLPLMHT